MTPIPIDLPVRTSEAATLAELVFEHVEGRKLNDSLRGRLAGRIATFALSSMAPIPGSLQRDPIHPSTYYLLADPVGSGPLLLRLALASSPSSGLFPKSLLIGRVRTDSGREAVVNAIPFAATDHLQIRTFAEQVDREFLPKLGVNLPAILASVSNASELWIATVWHAIRAGWRQGWSATLVLESPADAESARKLLGDFTRFSIPSDPSEASLERALETYDATRSLAGRRSIEFELDLTGSNTQTSPAELVACLHYFRSKNKPVQFIAPRLDDAECLAFQEAARTMNAVVSLDAGKIASGRVNYRGSAEVPRFGDLTR